MRQAFPPRELVDQVLGALDAGDRRLDEVLARPTSAEAD